MKTKFFMLLAAMLLGITSAFAQNENNELLLGDVNGDGVVDGADITAVIKIMKDGGGVATASSNYATKEDLAEILEYLTCLVTKAELAGYITKDVFGQLVDQFAAQTGNLTDADAALRVALENLAQEMYNKFLEEGNTISYLRDIINVNAINIECVKDDVQALQCDNANIKDRVEMNTADINFLKTIIDNQNSQIAELQAIIEELRNK